MKERVRDWEPIPLTMRLKPGQKPYVYAKPRRGYTTPAGLKISRDRMLKMKVDAGYMREVPSNLTSSSALGLFKPSQGVSSQPEVQTSPCVDSWWAVEH